MKLNMKITELLDLDVSSVLIGSDEVKISEVRDIDDFENGSECSLYWCSEKRIEKINNIKSGTVIVPKTLDIEFPYLNLIKVDNPRRLFQEVLKKKVSQKAAPQISKSAFIHESAILGMDIFIGHNVVIESDVVIGDQCVIDHNVVICEGVKIGNNCVIGANSVIGGRGFGFEKNEDGRYEHIPHVGGVVIKDNVEIGKNTCVDRGALRDTVIGENTKVDNLVQYAHGVQSGSNNIITSGTILAGSSRLGNNIWIGPNSSIINTIEIGDDSFVGIGATVIKGVEKGKVVAGNPARVLR